MGGVGWGVMGVEGSGKGSRMVLIVARVGPVGGMVRQIEVHGCFVQYTVTIP